MTKYPYYFYVALDGNGINGLEGAAGVCLFLYQPKDNSYAYKIKYFEGAAAGHWVSINPSRKYGFLGNAAQHLLFFDANTLEEIDRISTLQFETNDTSIRGSTHLVWLNDNEFITSIGDYFYKFNINNLSNGEKLGPHKLKLPHAMKLSASGKYICYGSMDNPSFGAKGEAKEVGVWNIKTGEATKIELPATCWHIVTHPSEEKFYAASFRVLPQDHIDYHEWAMAYLKEYAFEIDIKEKKVLRHWVTSRETPAHINSDMTISDKELIFCNGGSQTIILIDLKTLSTFRIIDEKPDIATTVKKYREVSTQVFDVLARGGIFDNSRHLLGAMRVSRFSLLDSIYACQLSNDQSLLFTANRGLNHITIYDYPSLKIRHRVEMPEIQDYISHIPKSSDPRLGFHHGHLISSI